MKEWIGYYEDVLSNELSKNILMNNKAKEYPDLITFAFWARRKNILSFVIALNL